MWETLVQEIQGQSWVDWVAVVTAILYLVLAGLESPYCWGWGIISCLAWGYAAFYMYDLYLDGFLQGFYVVLSSWGLYLWIKGGENETSIPISVFRAWEHIAIIFGGLLISGLVGWVFYTYTDAAAPYLDALTTVFSIIITFMVVYKKLENWLYWMVIDSIYVYLYWSRGGVLFSLLFVVYLGIVVVGYFRWRRIYRETQDSLFLRSDKTK